MLDEWLLAQLPRDRPLKVRQGPKHQTVCVINGCPIDEHSFVVTLKLAHGVTCANCADSHGFQLDWSNV